MTTAEANQYLTYYSMCNFMTDFIEDKWVRSNGNIKKVKYLTNQLRPELEKSINHIFQAKETEGVQMSNVLDQFVQASYVMEHLFKIGLEMDNLKDSKKDELSQRINDLLSEYGIKLNDN